jgi:predicted nucleic acid-binding protein
MTTLVAVDTSVAVPLLVKTHPAHEAVSTWAQGKTLHLSGHAAAETYSVLTRLPSGMAADESVAAELIDESFTSILVLPGEIAQTIHKTLARQGIVGGAVYDALVALAARENSATLATRDTRALNTYQRVGAITEVVSY